MHQGRHIFDRATLDEIAPTLGPSEIQIGGDLFIGPRRIDEREDAMIFTNHSCDPNIGIQGQIVFVALREIAGGEELTHDWATTDDDDYTMTCQCGAAECRRVITGGDWRIEALQRNIAARFPGISRRKLKV